MRGFSTVLVMTDYCSFHVWVSCHESLHLSHSAASVKVLTEALAV